MNTKLRVGVVFGGRSAEHEVSLVSAASVMNALDKTKYDVVPIGITPEGRWLSVPEAVALLKERADVDRFPEHLLLPDPRRRGLVPVGDGAHLHPVQSVDVVFPVLHGPYGEDGTIQGLFELADVPYVGAGVLGSALGMDKVVQKQLLRQARIPVVPDVWFLYADYRRRSRPWIDRIERMLKYPCFVKPPNLGSSIGITKAHDRAELMRAIDLAGEYDRKVLVERAVPNAREIECSVLGNSNPEASVAGEIIPSNEFYDYDAKYVDGKSTAVIPARLPKSAMRRVQRIAVDAFRILNCEGMARADFLIIGNGSRIYLNEINTIPGFTSISMYPKLWEASGLPYAALLDRLIQLALDRYEAKSRLKTRYTPKADWFRG